MQIDKTHFHKKGCALGLALKKRHKTTQKWPILTWAWSSTSTTFLQFKVQYLSELFNSLKAHHDG